MNRLHASWRIMRPAVFALAVWLASTGLLWAQAGGQPAAKSEPAGAPPYVGPYFLIVFCVGAGLAVLLASARRRDRAKPVVYGEEQ